MVQEIGNMEIKPYAMKAQEMRNIKIVPYSMKVREMKDMEIKPYAMKVGVTIEKRHIIWFKCSECYDIFSDMLHFEPEDFIIVFQDVVQIVAKNLLMVCK